jgi:aconitate hydratase
MASNDPFSARDRLPHGPELVRIDRVADPAALPFTICILLENLLRRAGTEHVTERDVRALAAWPERPPADTNIAYMPGRVIMQDLTGVPAVVDLAAMRGAVARAGGNAARVDPLVPVDLVIDHSVQVDAFGEGMAYQRNIEREYERNGERYALLRWAQSGFRNFRVVPPGMGIVHQVNLEYLARVVELRDGVAFPDTLVGTDSHTTMVNSLGVLGWGVGGIEAEAVMLGQPLYLTYPEVVGIRLDGSLAAGVTATDLVLTLTELLRRHGVVGKFVEFCGDGLSSLTVADRGTLSNMSPEYGATAAMFPVDAQTLTYLRDTGRPNDLVELVESYYHAQGLFREDGDPIARYTELLDLDLAVVEPSVAGPRRPQDRVPLPRVGAGFREAFGDAGENGGQLENGHVVISAITSCTNTSNPQLMLAAGLLARKAVERGLERKPWVKTSLAPGSRVVMDYLERAGLVKPLEALGFHLVGFGCTTCIGNSGPLPGPVADEVTERDLAVAAVLSGNRNFEARIHPLVRANYLASPPLVVAYALVGTVAIDLAAEPLGEDGNGNPVYLEDVWPSADEVHAALEASFGPELFTDQYGRIFEGDERWQNLPVPTGELFRWDPESTYIREATFFEREPDMSDIEDAHVLAWLGDSVTTDHISPAGAISPASPAGRWLQEHGVKPRDFNSYGARRGNHEVMVRGTFANIRLRNRLVDVEGGYTLHVPSGDVCTIYDASMRYQGAGRDLIVLAGKEYGSGSSRDWAAKGSALLGVRAVIAESFERIHRSNLIALGVLPLQFAPGDSVESLGISGRETFTIRGLAELDVGSDVEVEVAGGERRFTARVRFDAPAEVRVYRAGGLLQMMMRQLAEAPAA